MDCIFGVHKHSFYLLSISYLVSRSSGQPDKREWQSPLERPWQIPKYGAAVTFYLHCGKYFVKSYDLSVLGRDKGHTVKHSPLTERVSETEAQENSQGQSLYLTFNPELSLNTDSTGKTGVSYIFLKPNLRLQSTPV